MVMTLRFNRKGGNKMRTLRLICVFFLTVALLSFTADSMAQMQREAQQRQQLQQRSIILKAYPCAQFAFTSTSPLPQTTVGAHYEYQLQTSGGVEPLTFFLYRQTTEGKNTPDQIPRGLAVSPSGKISGQVDGSVIAQNYYFEVGVVDSCPSGARFIARKFYMLVKQY